MGVPSGSTLVLGLGNIGWLARTFPALQRVQGDNLVYGDGRYYRATRNGHGHCIELDLGDRRLEAPFPRFLPVPEHMTVANYGGNEGRKVFLSIERVELRVQE